MCICIICPGEGEEEIAVIVSRVISRIGHNFKINRAADQRVRNIKVMKCRHDLPPSFEVHGGTCMKLVLFYLVVETRIIGHGWERPEVLFSPDRVCRSQEMIFSSTVLEIFSFLEIEVGIGQRKVKPFGNPEFDAEICISVIPIKILFSINTVFSH